MRTHTDRIRASQSSRLRRLVLAVALTSAPALAGPGGLELTAGGESLLKRALGPEAAPAARGGGRELFEAVLASEAFRSGSIGPFDVHVLVDGGRAAGKQAEALRDRVLETLEPASALVTKLWPVGGEGLVSAARFPVVLAANRTDYEQLIALLDHCERAGYSGWAPDNVLDTPEARAAEVARTWEVQVFALSHAVIAGNREAWLEHGVGYYSLAFVANRALRQGAWGLVPPWLSSGLTDELDIAAYGQAWVGQESWVSQTPGWFRSGWSGFVPQGSRPPAAIAGPPADLGVTVVKTGDAWLDYDASRTRHWSELRADLETEAPASFARAAETESFLPRDRAAARCLLHLMLSGADVGADGGTNGGPALTALLDRSARTQRHGMPDSDALPVIFARALGGVSEIDRLEALDSRALLTELGRNDLIERLEQAQAGDALALSDHREQSAWLYRHACDQATRNLLFQSFLEIEYVQQLAEWRALGPHLDSGLRTALESARSCPRKERDVASVAQAFRAGLAQRADDTTAAAPAKSAKSAQVRSKRK